MEKFAGYGFNKSHAAAYALVAYQTAYLKAHYPAAFMAANLSPVMDDTDKVRQLHDDALAHGPRGPAARRQRVDVPLRAGRSRSASATAWAASRAPAQQAIEAIVAAREAGGPFRDLADFCRARRQAARQPPRDRGAGQGRRVRRDRQARATLLASLGNALDEAERAQAQAAQNSLFGGRRRAGARAGRRRASGATRAPAAREAARSASTFRAIRSTPTRRSCAASRARRSPTSSRAPSAS